MSKKKEELSPEEQLAAVERYRKAISVRKPKSDDFIGDLRKRKPSEETLEKFNHVLSQLFTEDAPWDFVATWALKTLYEEIQAEDPYVKTMTRHDIKRHVRMWLWKTKRPFVERTTATGGRPRILLPNGWTRTVTGYCRKGIWHIQSDRSFPKHCGYNAPCEPDERAYLHIIYKDQVLNGFKEAGLKFR